jgi:hypothetical protein
MKFANATNLNRKSGGAYPDFLPHRSHRCHYVVLPKENHVQLAEATSLDRKSGGAEGPVVPRTLRGYVFRPLRYAFSRPIGQSHVFSRLSSPQTIGKTYLRG